MTEVIIPVQLTMRWHRSIVIKQSSNATKQAEDPFAVMADRSPRGCESSGMESRIESDDTSTIPFPKRLFRGTQRRWRKALSHIVAKFAKWGARSSWFSWMYFAFWSRRMHREQRAMLAGWLKFQEEATNPVASCAQLRRGIHRLEKGLLMRPRRDVFGLDYIQDVFATYKQMLIHAETCSTTSDELSWANDVLTEYFEVTTDHPKIDPLRQEFRNLTHPPTASAALHTPYKRDLSTPPPLSYDELLILSQRRRSVRWFSPESVPRDVITKAVAIGGQSPSACNRQPFVLRIFDDPDLVQQVAELPYGTAGYAHNIPVVAVVVGQLRNYFDARDRHLIYIDASLAAMGFIYALETQGIGTCCINWPDIEERERKMEQLLKLEPDERPIMLIALGYPDPEGMVAYSQKKPVEQLCRFNFE